MVGGWKAEGVSNREIARRLGVDEKVVRKTLRRLGWEASAVQGVLPFEDADPNLSGMAMVGESGHDARAAAATPSQHEHGRAGHEDAADPNLSGVGAAGGEPVPVSLDSDPADRSVDRLLACMGLLDDAVAVFRPGTAVPGAGVLLAMPALLASGILDATREVYGSLGPAFYGLRTTLMTLLLMALLRIKRPECLKEHAPAQLGRLLGLDRAPEVKTLRRKLARLAALGRAADLGRALAARRVAARGHVMGFLYLDGHVRVYHGQRRIPKTHVARMRLKMSATTDYWVNDTEGEPLLVVSTEANRGLITLLPTLLAEVRRLVGERRVTVVFDRGGWSPKLFTTMIAQGFDVLTYQKGRVPAVPEDRFASHQAIFDGHPVHYVLADIGIELASGLRLRQVTRLGEDGHQTHIVTSRRDLPAVEVAARMFARWRQENFFKYLREEYALDALVDYATAPADPAREVPNPLRAALDAELHKAKAELAVLHASYGLAVFSNQESLRRTMRGFKIANAPLGRQVLAAMHTVAAIEHRRATVPRRVPIQQLAPGEVVKLATERKHLTDLLKMVAYQAESDLCRLVEPHYHRADDEARTLIQNALATTGDLEISEDTLTVSLDPLSSPHRTRALAAICRDLSATRTRFPGSALYLRFQVKPPPPSSPAFPGPRLGFPTSPPTKPDISLQG
jgi:hypothetical protein